MADDNARMTVYFENHELVPLVMEVDEADVPEVIDVLINVDPGEQVLIEAKERDYIIFLDKIAYIAIN